MFSIPRLSLSQIILVILMPHLRRIRSRTVGAYESRHSPYHLRRIRSRTVGAYESRHSPYPGLLPSGLPPGFPPPFMCSGSSLEYGCPHQHRHRVGHRWLPRYILLRRHPLLPTSCRPSPPRRRPRVVASILCIHVLILIPIASSAGIGIIIGIAAIIVTSIICIIISIVIVTASLSVWPSDRWPSVLKAIVAGETALYLLLRFCFAACRTGIGSG